MGNCSMLTQLTIQKNRIIVLPPSLSLCQINMRHLDLDRDPATNTYASPPNPIPSQTSFQFLRYLQAQIRKSLCILHTVSRLHTPAHRCAHQVQSRHTDF